MWIPVTEKTPEKGEVVVYDAFYGGLSKATFDGEEFDTGRKMSLVTHWSDEMAGSPDPEEVQRMCKKLT